jgi:hypothetical protein
MILFSITVKEKDFDGSDLRQKCPAEADSSERSSFRARRGTPLTSKDLAMATGLSQPWKSFMDKACF